MKIVFFGSDDFAVVNLEALIAAGHSILACVTPPDRAQGRHLHIVCSPVKECALRHNLKIFQPEDVKDPALLLQLKDLRSEVFVVIAYGKFLPEALLNIPTVCALNVHASFLPKYRGAAPVNWVVINGEQQTGITIMRMNVRMDAGDILAQEATAILDHEDSAALRSRLAEQGARLLCAALKVPASDWQFKKQEEGLVSLAPKLTKAMGEVDWRKTARQVHNLVLGLKPWPGAYTFLNGHSLKILASQVVETSLTGAPGEVLQVNKEGFLVATGEGALLVTTVQPESGKPMTAASFALGHDLQVTAVFGRAERLP